MNKNFIDAVEESFPRSKNYAFVTFVDEEVVYGFNGNLSALELLVDSLKNHIKATGKLDS